MLLKCSSKVVTAESGNRLAKASPERAETKPPSWASAKGISANPIRNHHKPLLVQCLTNNMQNRKMKSHLWSISHINSKI